MNFERLVYIRDELDLSQRSLAYELTIGKSTYARWETGEKIIPLKHLVHLCNMSGFSLDFALGLSDDKKRNKEKIVIDRKVIGENIRLLRKKNNLTQEDLAKELNTTHSTISAYESGKTLILTSFVYQIAVKHNVSVDWIIYNKTQV